MNFEITRVDCICDAKISTFDSGSISMNTSVSDLLVVFSCHIYV